MRFILFILIALLQYTPTHPHSVTSAGGCSLSPGSYTNSVCFNYTANPIGTPFSVATASGYVSAQSTTSGAISNPTPGKTLFYDSTNSYGNNQKAGVYVNAIVGSDPGVSGPCVRMDASGDAYCYLINLGGIYSLTAGSGSSVVSGCPSYGGGTGGDLYEIEVSGTTLTCRDVTLGTSATGTSSAWSTGKPGALADSTGGLNQFWITKFGAS